MRFSRKKYVGYLLERNYDGALSYLAEVMPNSLFKFFSLGRCKKMNSRKLTTLKENKIWVDLFSNQNDPFEMVNLDIDKTSVKGKKDRLGNELLNEDGAFSAYKRFMDYYKNTLKTASFSAELETNISMWAYYTNNHEGFCCEYEVLDRSKEAMEIIKPVLYSKRIKKTLALDVERWIADSYNAKTPFEAILSQRNKTEEIKGIASSKHVSWGNEKEFRAFYEGEDNGSGEAVFCSVLNLKIKAIYAGIKCKEKYKRKLQRIAKSLKVDYYEMHVSADRYSLYKELKK